MLSKIMYNKAGEFTPETQKVLEIINQHIKQIYDKLDKTYDNSEIMSFIVGSAHVECCQRDILESIEARDSVRRNCVATRS